MQEAQGTMFTSWDPPEKPSVLMDSCKCVLRPTLVLEHLQSACCLTGKEGQLAHATQLDFKDLTGGDFCPHGKSESSTPQLFPSFLVSFPLFLIPSNFPPSHKQFF